MLPGHPPCIYHNYHGWGHYNRNKLWIFLSYIEPIDWYVYIQQKIGLVNSLKARKYKILCNLALFVK